MKKNKRISALASRVVNSFLKLFTAISFIFMFASPAYAAAPTISSISPASGPATGGTAVTITGTNFTSPAFLVTIGPSRVSGVTVVNSTTITATTAYGTVGPADVMVFMANGTARGAGLFTYTAPVPTITGISPSTGPLSGGTAVIISGTNIVGPGTSVTIGGAAASSWALTPTSIMAITPAGIAGAADVAVTTPGGTATGVGLFTYVATPTVTAVSPNIGTVSGGTAITIYGSDLAGATSVTIGGTPATGVTVVNPTTVTAITPAGTAGVADVVVTTPSGTATGTGLFTYAAAPTVTAVSPNSGLSTGGTSVTISGTNFTGTTSVTIGGIAATGVTVVNSTTITATTPAGTEGIADVVVTTPGGIATGASLFTYVGPVVSTISPNIGPTAGGMAVTITGTGFTGATSVTIGGAAATGVTVVNSTTITATTPAGTAGTADVAVTTPSGTVTGTGLFTYVAPPTISSTIPMMSPSIGPTTGGTTVWIYGSNFTGATSVTIGGAPATIVTDYSYSIQATTPAGTAGAADVVVTTPGGAATGVGLFTYEAPPTVTAISPNSGSAMGGTAVTITGTNFTGATNVTIGGLYVKTFSVINSTTISATTNWSSTGAGTGDVVVTTPGGTGTGVGLFTYTGPTMSSITPSNGTSTGGTPVTITGSGFTGASSLTFNGVAATGVTVVNDTTITATTPAGTGCPTTVAVTTPIGTSDTSALTGALFCYSGPSISSVSPYVGPTIGGTIVTITGIGLTGSTSVTFGGVAATTFTVVNDTTITATAPPNTAGWATISVTTPHYPIYFYNGFNYVAMSPPTVSSISPNNGSTAGGTAVTITGTNFYFGATTSVTIGGVAATSVNVVNSTTIAATAPAGTAGAADVVVTTPGGSATGTALFTYAAVTPTVTAISPNSGSAAGGTPVTITGTDFTAGASVTIGGVAATAVTVLSPTTITATTPAGTAGTASTADVVVTTPGGTGTGAGLFYYTVPFVSSVSPLGGDIAGGTTVTIFGVNFTGATGVTFGGVAATGVTVVNDQTITAITPAGTAGTVDVVVTTPSGNVTASGMYTYQGLPTITSITPNSGPTSGGTLVTITGTNFSGAAYTSGGFTGRGLAIGGVYINPNIVSQTPTTITFLTPSWFPPGPVDVTVYNFAGSATATGGYTYLAAAPTITSISPNNGSTAGSTAVTITGTNFTGATSVTIGGAAATGVTVVNSTNITATTPPGTTGAADVVVTTPGGTATDAALFTYVAVASMVTAVSPASGPATGGTAITITGTNFTAGASVTIGGVAATGVTVLSPTTITATTPPGATGAADVAVTTPGGTATSTGLFTYQTAPTVTGITPNNGSTAGGTGVTITGTNFTGATSVTIGGVAATGVTVVSATQITATTPAGTAGAADVAVTTPSGTGTGTGLFTYVVPTPTVTGITPNAGPLAGGTAVTITGTNFTGATSVTIGGVAATGVSVVSATQITATTPAGTAGAADVAVTTSNGTGTGTGLFTYMAAPTVTAISPTSGPTTGGTSVSITGTNFIGAISVTIGGTAATSVTVVSSTQISAITPAGTMGAANVAVTTPGGTSTGNGLFTYIAPPPSVSSASPSGGSPAGGTVVTIFGSNFTGATSVTFGGVAATGITVFNDNTIFVNAPSGTTGSVVNITVTTPNGTGTGAGLYTYTKAPVLTYVYPTSGPTTGGTVVTISGTNFTGATSVTFGGVAATSVTVVNDTIITATTPPGAAGPANVVVTNGSGSGTGSGLFTYGATTTPTITGITPTSGPTSGGTAVTISGTNFAGATSVTIGGAAATIDYIANSNTIIATTPPGIAGAADVAVTTSAGTVTGTGLFTYTTMAAPTVTGISPNIGPTTGGQTVTITGTNFTGATSVTIGGAAATGVVVKSSTRISAVTPAGTAGAADVTVTTSDGTGTGIGLFTYVVLPDPTKDPDVTGLVKLQMETAKNFWLAQLSNFQQRLESLHHAPQSAPAAGNFAGVSRSLSPAGNAAGVGGAVPGRVSPLQLADLNATASGTASGQNSGGPWATLLANSLISAASTSSVNLDVGMLTQAMLSDNGTPAATDTGGLNVWGAGSLRFGTRSQTTGGAGIDFTTSGVTIGADRRINERLTLGMGVGYARDHSTIGADGTGSNATGNSLSAYGSYQAGSMFVDALLGYGTLSFDTTRYVAAANAYAQAGRSGSQTWGSLATGYEYRNGGLLLSPYARYNLGTNQLNAATETGAGVYSLNYASQSTKSQQLSLGFRAQTQYLFETSMATPRMRIEYQHMMSGDSQTSLAYADLISSRYNLTMQGTNTNSWLLGVGSGLALHSGWNLDAEYQRQHASGQENIQSIDLRLSRQW